MVILQCDDHAPRKRHAAEFGIRKVLEHDEPKFRIMQLHPRDTGGCLLEIDEQIGGEKLDGPWLPAGRDWQSAVRTDVVRGIAAAEAQIANLIPPIVNGKDFVQDPDAAVRFDKAELKRRIDMLHGFVVDAGRAPGSVEISGIAMVNLSRGKSAADAAARAIASSMGFPSEAAARNAPVLLIGTPEEVRWELRSRIEDFGMTYYIVFPRSEESRNLLVNEVMPEFA
jgi:hypothetical protein